MLIVFVCPKMYVANLITIVHASNFISNLLGKWRHFLWKQWHVMETVYSGVSLY
jgi:hypothetical protein